MTFIRGKKVKELHEKIKKSGFSSPLPIQFDKKALSRGN